MSVLGISGTPIWPYSTLITLISPDKEWPVLNNSAWNGCKWIVPEFLKQPHCYQGVPIIGQSFAQARDPPTSKRSVAHFLCENKLFSRLSKVLDLEAISTLPHQGSCQPTLLFTDGYCDQILACKLQYHPSTPFSPADYERPVEWTPSNLAKQVRFMAEPGEDMYVSSALHL
jgi:hypothetical protein